MEAEFNNAYSITFGDCAENHTGMELLGEPITVGLKYSDMKQLSKWFVSQGCDAKLYAIDRLVPESMRALNNTEPLNARLLVVKNGLSAFNIDADDLYAEMETIECDTKYYDTRRARVLNKHARHNVCFGDNSQDPDYENKKGRVVSFDDVENTNVLRQGLQGIHPKLNSLQAELNKYYDPAKTGIGFHGDSERKITIGCRIGYSHPIVFRAYYKGKQIGTQAHFELNHGDMYVMSDKTVGTDWKRRNIVTFRHAAGAGKYTK
jgi:hypothetical protein